MILFVFTFLDVTISFIYDKGFTATCFLYSLSESEELSDELVSELAAC
jgi:hypothetical protein